MDILTSLQSIGFDWQLAVAHLLNFLLVVGLLNYFVFDPLRAQLAERRETIKKGVADARQAEKDRFEAKEKYEEMLAAAKREKQDILTEAHEAADAVAEKTQATAREEAESIVADARVQIESERKQMHQKLQGKIGSLAVLTAEKIMQREVTDADHDKLVAEALNASRHD